MAHQTQLVEEVTLRMHIANLVTQHDPRDPKQAQLDALKQLRMSLDTLEHFIQTHDYTVSSS